jgi:AcrR family transcriptional regulator
VTGHRRAGSYHHGNLRAALVREASTVIRKQSAEACTLRGVARRVGVTHAAAYTHFADKQALLAAVASEGFENLARKLARGAARSPDDPEKRLRGVLRAYVSFCFQDPSTCALMFGPRIGRPGEYPELDEAVEKALKPLREAVEALRHPETEGTKSSRKIAIDLWTFAHGYGTLSYNKRVYASARAAAAAFDLAVTPMLRGLFDFQSNRW